MNGAIPTWAIVELRVRRREEGLWRIGPTPMGVLIDAILAERHGADIVDLTKRHRLTLPAAARQARAGA
jgi:hypothetical protein